MAIAFSDKINGTGTTAGSGFTATLPTGWADGDFAILTVVFDGGVTTTASAGWTESVADFDDTAADSSLRVYTRRLQTGDSAPTITPSADGNYAFTHSVYTGTDPGSEISGTPVTAAPAATSTPTISGVSVTGNKTVVLSYVSDPTASSGSVTQPSGTNKRDEVRLAASRFAASADVAEDGTGSPYSYQWSSFESDAVCLSAIVLAPPPQVRVVHFRKRGDANTLNSSTWDDDSGLDTDYSMGVDEPFRLRVGSEEFNGGNDSGNLSLQYSHNSGAWTTVPTSSGSPIYSALSTQFADGAATTQLFTGYASTWQAGEGDEQSNSAPGHDVQKATETEFALAIDSTEVTNGDTIDLRLVSSTPPDAYGSQDCGTITISEGPPTYIYYRTQPISGTIDSDTGLTREIRLRRDY